MYSLFKRLLPLLKASAGIAHVFQLHYQVEPTGRISIGGTSLYSIGHADHKCEDKGFVCVTNIPNRHKHCFHKGYYRPRPNKFRQSKTGAFVAAITVCSQGPFLPIESEPPNNEGFRST